MSIIKIYEKESISADKYPYAKFHFDKFNPVQSSLLDVYEKDANCIVASATSSGKTVCFEMFAAYNIRVKKKKVIYLSPLKSLSQEKLDDWIGEHHFGDCKISICTGDYRLTPERIKELNNADMIIMTSEMLNSLARNYKAEKNQFLQEVGMVGIDEFHQLGEENRGSHLESGVMKFSEMNPNARFVMLSATMPNINEAGEWVSYLNKKDTYLIESNYRPCKLNIHYESYWDEFNYDANERKKVFLTVQLVKKYPDDKFICFIHSKRTGESLMKSLDSAGIQCAYHNANLKKEDRIKIEKDFREKAEPRVIVATSGLSQGLNLPARRVIVVGIHRGLQEVKTQELIQMAGRSGRPQYDKEGDAYILLPRKKFEQHKRRLQEPVYIQSQMMNTKILAFHLVSEIHHRTITNINDVYNWYKRTLANFQKQKLDKETVEQVMKNLIFSGCVKDEDGKYSTTPIGSIASMFYYNPFDVADLYKNFNAIFKANKVEYNNWLAMALANTDSHRIAIVNGVEKNEIDSFSSDVYASNIEKTIYPKGFMEGAMKIGYCYKQLLEGRNSNTMNNLMNSLQMDFGRTSEILSAIDSMCAKWNQTQFFKDLSLRISYGVAIELVDLCKIRGIGRVKATKLYNNGLKELKDFTSEKVIKILKCSKKIAEEICQDAKNIKGDS